MLAAIRSILEYFTSQEYNWQTMERLLGYEPGKAAWTVKAWTQLAKQGFDIKMIENFDYQRYEKEGESYLASFLRPEELRWQLEHSNLLEIRPLIPEFLRTVQYEKRSLNTQDIDIMLENGYLVSVQLNSKVLNREPGYDAHMIVVYDKDSDGFLAHDPGNPPKEGRHIPPELMYEAMGGAGNTTEVTGVRLAA